MSARHNGRFWEREVAMRDGTSGATLIAAERRRQIEREDWTTDHDDGWLSGELALAAACYAVPPGSRESRGVEELWPWHTDEWKPSPDDRVKELAPLHPEWRDNPVFKAVLDGDFKALAAFGERGLVELILVTHSGMTTEDFEQIVTRWLANARHPRFDRPYTQLVYQPMLELLAHLAEQATDVLAAIERHQRLPLEVEQALASSDPEAEPVRQLVVMVKLEGDQARAGLQALLERLLEQRGTLLRALRALEGTSVPPGSPYRDGPAAPNYLDTTG